MTQATYYAGAVLGAYVVGALPFSFLIGRARGVDIRTVGSGNVGATNVLRSVGKPWGILAFVCDFLKGWLPVLLLPLLARKLGYAGSRDGMLVACAVGAVAGHCWTCFLGFKGGKGVATGAGALLGAAPWALAVGLGCWILIFKIYRYVSLASMLAVVAVAAAAWVMRPGEGGLPLPVAFSVLAALTIWRHKANIGRLVAGTENRAGASSAETDKAANADG